MSFLPQRLRECYYINEDAWHFLPLEEITVVCSEQNTMNALLHNPVFVLFSVLAPGLLLSRIRIGKISPGSGALFLAGIAAGMLGFQIADPLITLGLTIFMFILGLQSGPGFFNALGKRGIPYLIITATFYVTGIMAMLLCGRLFRLGPETMLGTYTGLFTSSSSLAVLMETHNPEGLLPAYGIAFPIGFISTLLCMEIIPWILKKNLYRQMKKLSEDRKAGGQALTCKKFIVEKSDIIGRTIDVINIREKTGATIALAKRKGRVIVVGGETVMEQGDIVQAVGDEEALEKLHQLVGSESFDSLETDPRVQGRTIVITTRAVADELLTVLDVEKNYGIVITRIYRNGIEMPSLSELDLALGDSVLAVGNKARLEKLTRFLGRQEHSAPETDFFLLSLGIAAGVALGSVHFAVPGLGSLSLGNAGGTLMGGMIASYLKRLGYLGDHLSTAGKQTLKELGLTLFIAGIGVKTGAAFMHADPSMYGAVMLSSFIVISLCAAAGFFVSYKVLRLNIIASLACLAGGLTSSPSLAILTGKIKDDYPLAYFSSIYPIAMLSIIASSQLLSLILGWLRM